MLFIRSENTAAFKRIISDYALLEEGDENGAKEHRVTYKDMDPVKGSATGYVAKYISKNIDGANLDCDIDGGSAADAAKRVEAWASCWGIRQFQQIGCTSVTVWREMRRMKLGSDNDEQLNTIHTAADEGNWAEFVEFTRRGIL